MRHKNLSGNVKRIIRLATSSKRNQLVAFAIIFALVGASALAINYAATGGPPCNTDREFKHEPNLGNACKVTGQLFAVKLADKSVVYTHGLDKIDEVQDELVRAAKPVTRKASSQYYANTAAAFASTSPPACATDYYYQVLFAVPPGTADRSASMVSAVRDVMGRANSFLQTEAGRFGVVMKYKFLCDSSGVAVTPVVLNTSSTAFSDISNELKAKGFNKTNVKYIIWRDQTTYNSLGGLATVVPDDRPTADNPNNAGPSFAIVYGQVLDTAGNPVPASTAMLFAHEMTHNIGAVQTSAANYSALNLHCKDGDSLMCRYGTTSTQDISGVCTDRLYYDCGYNDYFNPKPQSGTYLQTHWNVASSVDKFVTYSAMPSGNAALTINISAPPTSGSYGSGNPTVNSSPHSLGNCGTSKAIPMSSSGTGSITCSSTAGSGIGAPDGTNTTAPTINGYTFANWTGGSWNGTSCTNTVLAKCINLVSGQSGTVSGTITANYKQNTTPAPTATSLVININAPTSTGYTGGNVTITASPHAVGDCLSSKTIAMSSSGSGSVTCSSAAGYGIGSPDGTNITAPAIPGYYFSGWSGGGWSGTSCTSTATAKCVNIAPGGAPGTITANYSPVQARLTINVSPGISAPITGINHAIGYCGTSFTAPVTCYSGPGYPIGLAPDGSQTYIRAAAVSGYTFTGWSGGCSGTGDCLVGVSAGSSMSVTANYQPAQTAKLNIYLSGAPYALYPTSSPHSVGDCGWTLTLNPGYTTTCNSGVGYGIGIPDGTNITAPTIANYTASWSGNAEFSSGSSCTHASNTLCANLSPGQTANVTLTYTYTPPTTNNCPGYTYLSAICISVSGNGGYSYAYSTGHSFGTCATTTYTWFQIPAHCEGNSFGTPEGLYLYPNNPGNLYNTYVTQRLGTSTSSNAYCYSTYCYINYGAYGSTSIMVEYH